MQHVLVVFASLLCTSGMASVASVERVGGVPRLAVCGKAFPATAVMPSPAAKPGEVAVFTAADEYVTSAGSHVVGMAELFKHHLHRDVLPFCGVPFDSYELSDSADPRLPDYKVYVFPNAFTLSPSVRERIKKLVRRNGKTAIWLGAPGCYDGVGEGCAANVEDLTGVPVAFCALGADMPCDRMLAPVSGGTCERDGWRSVLMPLPPDAAALRDLFRSASAHVWIDTDDVLAAGRGYVMLHAASDGKKMIRLPGRSDVREIFGASPKCREVNSIEATMKCGETRVWKMMAR